jgi:hypothetical protein
MAITLSHDIKQCLLDGTGREPDGPIVKDRVRFDEIRIFLGEQRAWLPNETTHAHFFWAGALVGKIDLPSGIRPGDTITLTGIEGAFQLTIND